MNGLHKPIREYELGLTTLQLLLVDDQPAALKIVKEMLAEMGTPPCVAVTDPEKALTLLLSRHVKLDAVLCDWRMPGMSGLELLKRTREARPGLPFLMVTGAADVQSVLTARQCGVTGYIAKPFSSDELRRKLTAIARVKAHRG